MGNIIERRTTEREYPVREQITQTIGDNLEYIFIDGLNQDTQRRYQNKFDRKIISIKKSKAIQNLCHINGQTIQYFSDKRMLVFECDCIKDSILNIYNSPSLEENIVQIEKPVFTKTISKSLQKLAQIELNINLSKEFVIEIKPKEINNNLSIIANNKETKSDQNVVPTKQLTFCEQIIDEKNISRNEVKIRRQCVLYKGKAFDIQNVYGLSSSKNNLHKIPKNDPDQNQEKDDSEFCAICLTNNRETILLPCRHACLCSECSQILFKTAQDCPICRNQVISVVNIENNIK